MVGFVFLFGFLIWITGFDILRGLTGGTYDPPADALHRARSAVGG